MKKASRERQVLTLIEDHIDALMEELIEKVDDPRIDITVREKRRIDVAVGEGVACLTATAPAPAPATAPADFFGSHVAGAVAT